MQIHTATTLEDVRQIDEFLEDATWDHARGFLEAAAGGPHADHLRWMEEDGQPVACVQVFLHRYPIGRATLGMCLPEYPFVPPALRGRGHFKRLMADLFGWCRENGCPLVYSHGRKGLYTGLGYAPCYHHCMVLIRTADACRVLSPLEARVPTPDEVAAHAEALRRSHPLGRGLQCRDEDWTPDPAQCRFVLADGGLMGSAVIADTREGDTALTVTDARAAGSRAAASLLKAVAAQAESAGFGWLKLNCRRDDPLARMAVLAGGELRWSAGQERNWTDEGEDVDGFYLTDLRLALEQLLPELQARRQAFAGDAPSALRLVADDQTASLWLDGDVVLLNGEAPSAPAVRLPRKAMTQAVMGYAAPSELALLRPGCEVPPDCAGVADAIFPAREPHLIHENMAFAGMDELGLVP
jgi:GNAT superfamily N-acetyltransferase